MLAGNYIANLNCKSVHLSILITVQNVDWGSLNEEWKKEKHFVCNVSNKIKSVCDHGRKHVSKYFQHPSSMCIFQLKMADNKIENSYMKTILTTTICKQPRYVRSHVHSPLTCFKMADLTNYN